MSQLNEQLIKVIEIGIKRCGSAAKLARATGISNANISRWVNGVQIPKVSQIEPLLEMLGASLTIPDEQPLPSKEVHFVSPQILPAGEGMAAPAAEDFLAIPIVPEIMAKKGIVSPIDLQGWFMVPRNTPSIRYKKDLLAVVKDPDVNKQEPFIAGGDIVIVDRDDCEPGQGDFMLVCDPKGRGMICRVSETRDGDGLTFFSDSKIQAPQVYSIKKDYAGDPRRAIIGRVLFGWCNLQGR